MVISRNLSKQPFSTGSDRKTLRNYLRDYFHLLKSPDFRLLVLKFAGSYSQVFTVYSDYFSLSEATQALLIFGFDLHFSATLHPVN